MDERVSLPLARLIYDYIKNRRDIDKTFIDKVVEIVVANLSLNNYVRGIKINNTPWNGSNRIKGAEYNYYTKKLTIELQATIELLASDIKNLRLNNIEKFGIIYDRLIQLVLHELEHANQLKKVDTDSNSLERRIILATSPELFLINEDDWFDKLIDEGYSERDIYIYLTEKKKRYYEYYKYAPTERLAESYSHKTMATIFKEIGSMPNISYYECLRLCENYLIGYKEGIIPTEFYLSHTMSDYSWEEINDEKEDLDFETRASLGLPISDDEYNYLLDTTSTLRELVIR